MLSMVVPLTKFDHEAFVSGAAGIIGGVIMSIASSAFSHNQLVNAEREAQRTRARARDAIRTAEAWAADREADDDLEAALEEATE